MPCNNQKIASLRFAQKYVQATDMEKSRVLEITVKDCRQIPALTLELLRLGDYLRYEIHNCDLHNDRSYLFSHDLFPLAFVEVKVARAGLEYTLLDSVESIDYAIPELRVIRLDVEVAKKGIIANFDDAIDSARYKIVLKQESKDDIAIDYGANLPVKLSWFRLPHHHVGLTPLFTSTIIVIVVRTLSSFLIFQLIVCLRCAIDSDFTRAIIS